jgi:Arc/MetJ-type ribon-helix-helix transcriptional regulator
MFTIELSDEDEKIIASIRQLYGYSSKASVVHYALKQLLFKEVEGVQHTATLNLGKSTPERGFVGTEE